MACIFSAAESSFLRPTSAGGVDHLALQVGEIHHVEIDEADAADARGRQIQAQRRAQSAGAHQQHLGGLQLLLAFHAHFGDDQVAAVAQDFVLAERGLPRAARPRVDPPAIEGTSEMVSPSFAARGVLAQVADVFVVQVHVDEAAHLAFVVEDLLAQVGELRR